MYPINTGISEAIAHGAYEKEKWKSILRPKGKRKKRCCADEEG